jgi:hypothetical protein
MRNIRKEILLITLLLASGLFIPICKAGFEADEVNVYMWVDKTQYKPGETITLNFTIYNAAPSDIVIYKIKIETPWFMYTKDQWEGNQTLQTNNKLLRTGQAYNNYTLIQIPTDGRAYTNDSSMEIIMRTETNLGTLNNNITAGIANPLVYSSVREIDTVILLMAVLTILIVICTALIAASIFLSTRKPYNAAPEQPETT